MLLQRYEIAPAIAVCIFQLPADVAERFSFPTHRRRRELPARMAGNALISRGFVQREIAIGVANCVARARNSGARLAAPRWRPMFAMLSALKRVISRWMTVHASRVCQKFSDLGTIKEHMEVIVAM
jgi:hypothetical protein